MDEQIQKPPKIEYKPKRFFLSSLNTYFGNILVETLRNDKEHPDDPNLIVGSLANVETKYKVPSGVRKVIETSKLTFFAKVLLDSDVIVYDLFNCDLNEAEFAIKTLKNADLKEEKTLIFVSSVMVWSNSSPKEKKEGDDVDDGDAEEANSEPELGEPMDPQDGGDDPPPKKEYVRFTEADYTRRRALPQYEAQKALETMCLSAGSSKKNLKTFVLCAGILYGMGELVFYEHFKTAWLQEPNQLTYYGDGRNRIPCIHVKDLALFVSKVAERPPQQNYIFAIDHNTKTFQKKIVQAISKGVGTGETKSVDVTGEKENEDVFTIDIRMKPTKAFDQFIEEAANQDDNVEEGQVPPPKYTFNWWCKDGILKNIDKINKEFNSFNKLDPIRIFITGPPAIGKTFWAKEVSKYFNLPYINILDVTNEFKNQQTEEGATFREQQEELRGQMIEDAKILYQLDKKKRKALGLPIKPFREDKIIPRFTDQQLFQAFKWRLSKNDCQNRGYVLDGYPKTYQDARGVFLKPEKSEDDQNQDEGGVLILDTTINPQSVIHLYGDDTFLLNRISCLPEDSIVDTHYTPEEMQRRLELYRKINKLNTGFPIMLNFFKEQKIDVVDIDCTNKQNKIFESIRAFIERNGRFNNYREHEGQNEQQRLDSEQKRKEDQISRELEQQQKRDTEELTLWKLQEEEYKIKQEQSHNYEREVLDSRSQPLRQYLNDNVVPFLTEGLIELLKNNPEDPVDFLAEFLFKRSLQVEFPDPVKYFDGMK